MEVRTESLIDEQVIFLYLCLVGFKYIKNFCDRRLSGYTSTCCRGRGASSSSELDIVMVVLLKIVQKQRFLMGNFIANGSHCGMTNLFNQPSFKLSESFPQKL